MLATEWLPLIVKALATASLVVSASVAAERLGPVWGAIIASLPVSAGPAYIFLAMQHDAGFVASSALNSAAANAATGLFLIAYAAPSRRLPHWPRLGIAIAAWLLTITGLQQANWSVTGVAVLNGAVYGVGLALFGRPAPAGPGSTPQPARPWFELPVRDAAVAAFVSSVVAVSSNVGPTATGLAAVFPISLISLTVIVQRRLGSRAATGVAAKALAPMLGFGVMLLVLHLCVPVLGVAAALSTALASCILWSAVLLLVSGWRRTMPGSYHQPTRH